MDPLPDLIGLEFQTNSTAQRNDLAEALAAGQPELKVCTGQHRMYELVQGITVYLAFITVNRSHEGCSGDHSFRVIRLIHGQPQANSPKLGQSKPLDCCAGLATDDVGTCSSSRLSLHNIPIHSLKTDGWRLHRQDQCGQGSFRRLLQTMASIVATRGIEHAAEGTEPGEQTAGLRTMAIAKSRVTPSDNPWPGLNS
jgi:hypothetical protein